MKKAENPKLIVETGTTGHVGVLRDLHQIQLSVPDKHFFVNRYRGKRKHSRKKDSSGLFGGLSLGGGKKSPKLDIERAVEKVKMFHNSFQGQKPVNRIDAEPELGKMSVSDMNTFRREVREITASEASSFRWVALDAIIKYIDLKNSGVVKDRQAIQQDCLRKIGEALHEDGGLSMFHATWFLTLYRDYLNGFKMFRQGEVERFLRDGGSDAKNILKKLQQKQFEIPVYLSLVRESAIDVKLLMRYSQDNHVKRSRHGQKGCTRQEIKKMFQEAQSSGDMTSSRIGKANEVNIIMAYAQVFARIPMLYEVVEFIKSAIPNISTDCKLYRQKISLAQKITLLDIARVVYRADASDNDGKKLYKLTEGIYKYCSDIISENGLAKKSPETSIHTFPIMKQASLLITYRNIFEKNIEQYTKYLEMSSDYLNTVKKGLKSSNKALIKIAGYADAYLQKLETIAYEVRSTLEKKEAKKKAGYS